MRIAAFVSAQSHWLILPVVALLLFPSTLMWLGFLALIMLFILRWFARGAPFATTNVNLPILILLAMVAIGFVASTTLSSALATLGQVIASVSIFFVLVDYIHFDRAWMNVAVGLVGLGVLFALVAPFTVTWSASKLFGLPEFYDRIWLRLGEETNPNILAGALAPIVPIALAMVVQKERRWRIIGAMSLAPMIVILLLLQSRGAFFALAAGLVIWLALYNRWVLPLAPLVLLAFLAINNFTGGISLANLLYGETSAGTPGTLVQRQELWVQSLALIRESPFWGNGLGAFSRTIEYINHSHNLFIQVALDTGVIGLAAFVAIWLVAIRAVLQNWRAQRHWANGILASFAVLFVHGLGDVIVWGTAKSSVVLWIVFALALTLDARRNQTA